MTKFEQYNRELLRQLAIKDLIDRNLNAHGQKLLMWLRDRYGQREYTRLKNSFRVRGITS